MSYCKLSATDIKKRIDQGDLVVYLNEEYGYRYWYWFPNMLAPDLVDFWKQCDVGEHFYNPSGLPGDVIERPERCYHKDWFENWFDNETVWRAHIHQRDDSYLKGPNKKIWKPKLK